MFIHAVVAAVVLASGQTADSQFVGTWTMNVNEQTCARLELQMLNGALSGRLSLGSIHVNDEGEIDRVLEPATRFMPLVDVVNRSGVLTFAAKDDDADVDRFELRAAGETAQLVFLFTDEFRQQLKADGIPAPRPITLIRTRP